MGEKITTKEPKDWLPVFKIITDGLFRKLLAFVVIVFGSNFLFKIAIMVKGETRMMIVGSVITLITTVFVFYFGTSQSSQDKDKRIDK